MRSATNECWAHSCFSTSSLPPGLTDRSRRPYPYAHQLPFQVENYILNVKREHASWGARKIRERLIRRFSGIPIPAADGHYQPSNPKLVSGRCVVVPDSSAKFNYSLRGPTVPPGRWQWLTVRCRFPLECRQN
jgi:hypothetical protein